MLVKCRCGRRKAKGERCNHCGRGNRPKPRSSTQRGYGYDHVRIRKQELTRIEFMLCVHCLRDGKMTETQHLDHIVRFRGRKDPMRTDPYNRQPLCEICHAAKSDTERKGKYDVSRDLQERREALEGATE